MDFTRVPSVLKASLRAPELLRAPFVAMTPDGQPFLQMRNFPKAWMADSESIEAKLRRLGCHVAL